MNAVQTDVRTVVGIAGLGIMGIAYARNLCKAGYVVVGFDPAPEAAAALAECGGEALASPRAVAEQADIILIALASIPALRDVTMQFAEAAREDQVVAEMGTLPLDAKEAARDLLAAKGCTMLDCPVSGTGAQAATGDLVIFASGDSAAFDKIKPVFEAFARDVRHVGAFGAGIKLKYVANLLVTIHNLAAAEALLLAQKSGLDLQMVYDAVRSGAGNSRMFEVRGPMMISDTYEPATMKMDVYMKDLTLILDHARDVRAPLPLMTASLPYYMAALSQGRDKQDTAALFAVLKALAPSDRKETHI
ncbi:NAD(P)-dependent oxidoreductase [Aquamicrobium sp. LC103]|uniref:NAD(P)-dependent oxidoreductase n=1 Tax=Aquamicrobium sp. LC103 TaxID=1120658 RepID=UPI00063ED114|nr:NAD(P)-dependent oxidoreductase [Aquamicrobium sp. LC103]TKT69210.1 NAD(P)-dependent oxidoreductase [Aquamicrobium sp. LC103]